MQRAFTPIILLIITVPIAIGIFIFLNFQTNDKTTTHIDTFDQAKQDLQEIQSSLTDFTASFEIYTNGTKRIFTASMYHNQSEDVYITPNDPSIIHVKKPGTTWSDFFQTLPFSLTADCLTTGNGETYCSNSTQKLMFLLNGESTPNALNNQIQPGDKLVVKFEN
jgi:hypothetical protein